MAIDAGKWTSDWAVGREILAAYQDARHKDLCLICLGDPATPSGFLVEPVGEALAEYHPRVFGTLDEPVHAGNIREAWARHGELWRASFTVVAAPRAAGEEEIGLIVPSRAGYVFPGQPDLPPLGDIVLYATVFLEGMEDAGVPANPHLERRARRAADMIVDGVLRFFHKIQYDHTAYRRPRRRGQSGSSDSGRQR
ncbi:MAG: DUF1256 domain-containing protein [Firmicutes bacterium]|nr:DUF1256 domain-containing protein [Bacillota bacterium]